ncbi:MAG: multidrug effflux MFS transporter [Pseudomonadota bacterium]
MPRVDDVSIRTRDEDATPSRGHTPSPQTPHHTYSPPPTGADHAAAPLALLILVSMIQPTAMNMYVPAMADMRQTLGTSASAIQATLSAFLAATAIGQLIIGPFSDLFGRRPVLVIGLGVFVAGSIICALAPTVEILVAGRIIQAVGGCTGLALSRAIIRDIHGAKTSASMIGYVTMGMAVAPMLTPALGGVIHEASSWRWIFVFMGAFGAVALVATIVRLGETHTRTAGGGRVFSRWFREMGAVLSFRAYWTFVSTLAFLCVSYFAFIAGGTFVAVEVFELSASTYGAYFILIVSGYVLGNFVTGRFGPKIGIIAMIRLGNAVSLASVLVAVGLWEYGCEHPLGLFIPMFFVGLGNGFALPNAVAGAVSVCPWLAGTASGLAGAFQVGSGAVASVIVGIIIDANLWPDSTWPVLAPMLFGAVAALITSAFLDQKAIR